MHWNDAIALVHACGTRMTQLYGRPVFDEWAVLRLDREPAVLFYQGPRREEFRRAFPADSAPLRAEAGGRRYEPGDFEFARDSGGSAYDALLALGGGCVLVCNHVRLAMTEIRADPAWRRAQVPFVELSERFRADPLERPA